MEKTIFNEFLNPTTINTESGNVLEVYRCVVDKEVIDKYKSDESNNVKFIFFNTEYSDLSFDSSVTEIHKFKSKYRGNSHIRIPLTIVKNDDNKYVLGFDVCQTNEPDGYAVISKLDLITNNTKLKTASKAEKESEGTAICLNKMHEYNSLLRGEVFLVKEKDCNNNCLSEKIVCGRDKLLNKMIENDTLYLNLLKNSTYGFKLNSYVLK